MPSPNNSDTLREEAFVTALTANQSALRGYYQAALGHGDEAQEALQRTNVVLWKKNRDWNPQTDFLPWATDVARFEVLGVVRDRHRKPQQFLFDSDVVEQLVDNAAVVARTSSTLQASLEFCLQKFCRKNREILTAFYTEGRSVCEIAEAAGQGQSAVKMILMQMRKSLGECIEIQLVKDHSA